MANYKTRKATDEEYNAILDAAQNGFYYTDENGIQHRFRPNAALVGVLQIIRTQALRVSDATKIKLADIRDTGNGYELDIYEKKTGKHNTNPIDDDVQKILFKYASAHKIGYDEYLFKGYNGKPITATAIRKQLTIITNYLNIKGNISTHSFRKAALTEIAQNSDIYTAMEFAHHSSPKITMKYIDVGGKVKREMSRCLSTHAREM